MVIAMCMIKSNGSLCVTSTVRALTRFSALLFEVNCPELFLRQLAAEWPIGRAPRTSLVGFTHGEKWVFQLCYPAKSSQDAICSEAVPISSE